METLYELRFAGSYYLPARILGKECVKSTQGLSSIAPAGIAIPWSRMMARRDRQRFPPAESPSNKILDAGYSLVRKRYAAKQSWIAFLGISLTQTAMSSWTYHMGKETVVQDDSELR